MTLSVAINEQFAHDHLEHLIKTQPQRTNGGWCKYTTNSGNDLVPNCIVGQFLFDAGVPVSILREMDCEDYAAIDSLADSGRLGRWGIILTPGARYILAKVQVAADGEDSGDTPWGEISLADL